MRTSLVVALLCTLGSLHAQHQTPQSEGRTELSLNGRWEYVVDAYSYLSGGKEKGISRGYIPKDRSERVEFGFTPLQTLNVPGDWNTQSDPLFFYEGTVWYKREFDAMPGPGRRSFLSFSAVSYEADVYLNGVHLGRHEGAFTPFRFECTASLRPGTNVLVVRVNNDRRPDRVPAMDFDWWNFGGITRDVSLLFVPATFISDHSLQLKNGDSGTIEGWIELDGQDLPGAVEVRIDELGVRQRISTSGQRRVPVRISAKPKLWSPDAPVLYDVLISAENDRIRDRIGFRTVAVSGYDIVLNGSPIFLRGICMHDEALFTGGRIVEPSQVRQLFETAKAMKCNFVRLAHYPHPEYALRLADEMGLLVWAEIPVWQKIAFNDQTVATSARRQLEEMIVRDKNRASIILWSVSNETDEEGNGRSEFLRSLISRARKLDPTRLITMALHKQMVNDTTMRIEDPVGADLDVLAVNEYIGWYQGLPEDCERFIWETVYEKPHIVSEFGAEAVAGFHADERTMWSEEFQARLYRQQLAMFDRIPFLRGISPWILKDFRSPRRMNPEYQRYWNNKGVISNEGQRKQTFELMRKYYEGKK